MSVPNFADLAASIFHAFPADIAQLRAVCDQTDALRNQFGEGDSRVQAGETTANNLKGLFTRRIAWACHQQDARFGLRAKSTGQIATRRVDGKTHATDALMLQDTGQIVDCMSDRDVSWIVRDGDTQPVEQWLAPLAEDGTVVPDSPPDSLPNSGGNLAGDLSTVLASLDTLRGQILAQYAAIAQALSRLDDRVAALAAKPDPVLTVPPITFPSYEAKNRYLGSITLTPKA